MAFAVGHHDEGNPYCPCKVTSFERQLEGFLYSNALVFIVFLDFEETSSLQGQGEEFSDQEGPDPAASCAGPPPRQQEEAVYCVYLRLFHRLFINAFAGLSYIHFLCLVSGVLVFFVGCADRGQRLRFCLAQPLLGAAAECGSRSLWPAGRHTFRPVFLPSGQLALP